MSLLDHRKIKKYLLGKKYVALDDAIKDQGIIPDTVVRRKLSMMMKDLGWGPAGRKRIDGEVRKVWSKLEDKQSIELEITRLELLEKRQESDLNMLDAMLERDFSRDQCMKYLMMLYNSDLETSSIAADEEKEALNFAEKIEEIIDTKMAASKLVGSCAYMFYVEKYFPGLMSENLYREKWRKVCSQLYFSEADDKRSLEWKALSFSPHFLDLATKLKDTGDYKEFKEFLIENFITKETVDNIFPDGVDYKVIAGMCSLARLVKKGNEKKPFNWTDKQYGAVLAHLQGLHKEYE